MNVNVHYHLITLDGAYSDEPSDSTPRFHQAPQLTDLDVGQLVFELRTRIIRHLKKRGKLSDDELFDFETLTIDEPLLAECYAASVQGKIAFGEKRGQNVERLDKDPTLKPVEFTAPKCAQSEGFSLHGNTRIAVRDRDRLERLLRYVARPPLAQERLKLAEDGKIIYFFKAPFRDGTTRVALDPLTFIEKLAALIPAPRAHLVTYHGVLAPASPLRHQIVPAPPNPSRKITSLDADEDRERNTNRFTWAELLKRVFQVDVLVCYKCKGFRELIAIITQRSVIQAILNALELPDTPPKIAPARASPLQTELDFI